MLGGVDVVPILEGDKALKGVDIPDSTLEVTTMRTGERRSEREQCRDRREDEAPPLQHIGEMRPMTYPACEQAASIEASQGTAPRHCAGAEAGVGGGREGEHGGGKLGAADTELRHTAVQAGEGRPGWETSDVVGAARQRKGIEGVRGDVADMEEWRAEE